SEQQEREVALRTTSAAPATIEPVVSREQLRAIIQLVPRIPVTDEAVTLAVRYARATRPGTAEATREVGEYVRYGAGPRGSQALVLAAKARAALRGEAAADVDDVRALLVPTLRHRLVLSYRADAEGVTDLDILAGLRKAIT